jgi:hypothetical protein
MCWSRFWNYYSFPVRDLVLVKVWAGLGTRTASMIGFIVRFRRDTVYNAERICKNGVG